MLKLILNGVLASRMVLGTTIIQNTAGTSGIVTEYFGESFTAPVGGPWYDINFNFYSDIPAATPVAEGTAFLLTQEYLGTPLELDLSTPGFLAQSLTISDGRYIFSPSVRLQPNTQYWLYENGLITTSGGNSISGGLAYFAGTDATPFSPVASQAANFLVTGTIVPEPTTMALLLITLGAGLGLKSRRLRTQVRRFR